MSFGKRLKSLLAKKRQSQMDFALRLGITRSRLCNYINDRSEPDYATLCTIAEALQVSVAATGYRIPIFREAESSRTSL